MAPEHKMRLVSAFQQRGEVVAVTPAGDAMVFDATVPGTHNFVANDIVVHNSIEQDADVVLFIYRDEYYNPESDQRGLAEIIIAKHRNGPTGSIELVFMNHLAKFVDAATRDLDFTPHD